MMKTLLTAALLAFSLPSAAFSAPAARTVGQQGVWIDVRSAEEFQSGHLKHAVHIPVERIAADISRFTADKNTPVHLYCRSGRRAEAALQTLKKLGYTNIHNHGGYENLKAQGLR